MALAIGGRAAGASDPPPRRDPDEIPKMRAPHGQPVLDGQRRWVDPTRTDGRRRFSLSVMPIYSALRLAFVGRPADPIRGGGVAVDFDIQLWRTLWLRIGGGYAAHQVFDEATRNEDDQVVELAAGGAMHATQVGIGLAYALDLGRVAPIVDAGGGALFLNGPPAIQAGQPGGECRGEGVCDPGLSCRADNVCRVLPIAEVHAGLGVDFLVRERLWLGAYVRYFALLSAPSDFPIYLWAGARIGVRF